MLISINGHSFLYDARFNSRLHVKLAHFLSNHILSGIHVKVFVYLSDPKIIPLTICTQDHLPLKVDSKQPVATRWWGDDFVEAVIRHYGNCN